MSFEEPCLIDQGPENIKLWVDTYIWNKNGLDLEYSLWTTHKSATDAELSLRLLSWFWMTAYWAKPQHVLSAASSLQRKYLLRTFTAAICDKWHVHYKLLALQEEQGRVRHVGNHGLPSHSVVGLVLSERVLCIDWRVSAAVEHRLDSRYQYTLGPRSIFQLSGLQWIMSPGGMLGQTPHVCYSFFSILPPHVYLPFGRACYNRDISVSPLVGSCPTVSEKTHKFCLIRV